MEWWSSRRMGTPFWTISLAIFISIWTGTKCQLIRDRSVTCNSNSMEVSFEFSQPFDGTVYANDFYSRDECRWEGTGSRRLLVPVPLTTQPNNKPYCGVTLKESSGEFSVMLLISPMKGLLVQGMMGLTVRCLYNIGDVTLTLPTGPNGAGIFINPQTQAGVVTGSGGSPFLQMAIRDGHGIQNDIVQSADVGDRITLDIIMQDTTIYDFYVHDCYAHDGTNTPEASISIIDANGCAVRLSRAVDVPVFETPPVAQGAKHVYVHMYGFQFTTSQLVYFECQVRPCLQSCGRRNCIDSGRSRREIESLKYKRELDELPDNYTLKAVIRINAQRLIGSIPAARDAPILEGRASALNSGDLCVHTHVAIAILVIFVIVCVVSLVIAIFVCHRAQRDSKGDSASSFYSPSSTPTHPLSISSPSPRPTTFRSGIISRDRH